MNPFEWLNSQWWVRPALMVLTGAAYATSHLTPSYTVAGKAAAWILGVGVTLGSASLGRSNSGLTPKEGDAAVLAPVPTVPLSNTVTK